MIFFIVDHNKEEKYCKKSKNNKKISNNKKIRYGPDEFIGKKTVTFAIDKQRIRRSLLFNSDENLHDTTTVTELKRLKRDAAPIIGAMREKSLNAKLRR